MPISPAQHTAIRHNALPMSWHTLGPWRLRHGEDSTDDGVDQLLGWLDNGRPQTQALSEEVLRCIGQRLWRLEPRPTDAYGLRAIDVVCGERRWTLWLSATPPLQLWRIERTGAAQRSTRHLHRDPIRK